MAGGQFLTFLRSSSRSSMAKPTRPFFYNTIKNYGQAEKGNHSRLTEAKRAPSTAEEFQRVAEEKAKESSQQGVASQTVDKAYDGAEEAIGNSNVESVKNRFKEHEPGADYHKKGDN